MRNLFFILLTFASAGCASSKLNSDKIQFDISQIQPSGLENGQVIVDYEYCIPNEDKYIQKLKVIDPDVRILQKAKGRIGCKDNYILCISTTSDSKWKKQLARISNLDYVERIERTHYE